MAENVDGTAVPLGRTGAEAFGADRFGRGQVFVEEVGLGGRAAAEAGCRDLQDADTGFL
jgi:hypothetical protein